VVLLLPMVAVGVVLLHAQIAVQVISLSALLVPMDSLSLALPALFALTNANLVITEFVPLAFLVSSPMPLVFVHLNARFHVQPVWIISLPTAFPAIAEHYLSMAPASWTLHAMSTLPARTADRAWGMC
jgi:hypothetical protein